ncbi:hypothetical protein ASE01_02885 [Nocardioides sp. Root190]|uniref:phosphotransferase family protein n=1 Tax=Nocardioides sp. Root190 TaxID=1736488 RepID=UPI0007013D4A|nr:phosphotransferase [Nocardioides sp. Root190]KRB80433.1 hypothetical protein ASE01_02885 [Nocardioides sp. Root190]
MSNNTTPSPARTAARALGRMASTGGCRLAEVVPGSRRLRSVPASVGDLTEEWLTGALCGEVPGARVLGFTADGATSQTTSRATLDLTYNDAGQAAGLPDRVFAKLTTTFQQRLFMGLIRCIDGEPLFYCHLRGGLTVAGPQGYFGDVDPVSWRSIVLMEDVATTQAATFLHSTSQVSRSDIESLLLGMASFHGSMSNAQALTDHAWLKRPIDHFHNTSAFLNMKRRVEVGVERSADVVPDVVQRNLGHLWTNLLSSMSASSEGDLTLLHGDPHVGNTYRTGDGTVTLLDWQVCMKGSWAFDVAYAIGSALTVEDRRAWEDDLLAMYLDAFGAAGGVVPDLDTARRLYRENLMYPFHTWTTVLGRSALQPRMQEDDVSRLIIERLAHAIADHGSYVAAP